MAEIKPRYEFRIWGQNLAGLRDQLQRLGAAPRTESSKETYLISAATDRCNAKIRRDLMDIKVLIGTERGLEQWKPVLKAEFPLERSVIAAQIFPALELAAPQLSCERYPMKEFLGEIIGAQPRITVLDVSKTRLQFSVDECQAEFASVTINNLARDTVALESADADAVLRLTRRLGLEGAPNTSYIRAIKDLLES
jgi:exopolyphosphatase / guanosine-5'-triphosphate,3'-diphosphate pyrophosphatase